MKQVRKQADKARTPTPRRFRIVKLEERIAPTHKTGFGSKGAHCVSGRYC